MEVEVGKITTVCFISKWRLSRYMNGVKLTHPCWHTLSWGRNRLSRKVYGAPCARTLITGQPIVLYNPCSHRAQVVGLIRNPHRIANGGMTPLALGSVGGSTEDLVILTLASTSRTFAKTATRTTQPLMTCPTSQLRSGHTSEPGQLNQIVC